MGLYSSLAANHHGSHCKEAQALCGFDLGNKFIPGCLSQDEDCRIHSCEPGEPCSRFKENSGKMVWIIPIVTRTDDGSEVFDVGAGGGMGDLYQAPELEVPDKSTVEELDRFCREHIHDSEVLCRTRAALSAALASGNKTLSLNAYGIGESEDSSLENLLHILGSVHSDNFINNDDKKLARRPEGPKSKPEQNNNGVIVSIFVA